MGSLAPVLPLLRASVSVGSGPGERARELNRLSPLTGARSGLSERSSVPKSARVSGDGRERFASRLVPPQTVGFVREHRTESERARVSGVGA